MFLQNTQERDLSFGRKLSDFIEEDRASFGQLKAPYASLSAPVNAPFSWPNNSDAIRSRGMAAQFTLTKAVRSVGTACGRHARQVLCPSLFHR